MQTRIADTLVLVFTKGVSLAQWRSGGGLARELALYEAIAGRYDRFIFLTYGGPDEAEILATSGFPALAAKTTVICNSAGKKQGEFAAEAPGLVAAAVGPGKRIVVKTNQLKGGAVAVRMAEAVRAAGSEAALIARGGYLWSRFVAHEQGSGCEAARLASEEEGELCRAADLVVGTTGRMVEDLAWRYGVELDSVCVVPNYVTVEAAPPQACDREPGTLLYAGQLIPRKRVEVLVEAMSHLPEELRSSVTLEIIGDGVNAPALKAQAEKTGARVIFRERVPHAELLERMRKCTVYVQASELEGHPKTVLEAMACGAPVVVADSPGQGGVVRHGATGLKVPCDPLAFAHVLSQLIPDTDWRDILGSTAATTTQATFGLQVVSELEAAAHTRALLLSRCRGKLPGAARLSA